MYESVKHVLWECSVAFVKNILINLDGISQINFYLKSSFYKTKYIFDQVYGNVMATLIIRFQILRLLVWHMEFAQGENLSFRFI